MSTATVERTRVRKGVPTGGEFTARQRGEADVSLVAEMSEPERLRTEAWTIRDNVKANHPDVTLHFGGSGQFMVLDMISVPKDKRGQGLARSVMQELVDAADETGRPMALSPTGDLGSSKARLIAFYRSFGFVPNSGRNKDFGVMESMIRPAR